MALGKKTGGRKKGSRNKGAGIIKPRSVVPLEILNGKTPLEFLLETMRDESQELFIRLDCGKAAAPYLHSRKAQQVEVSGKDGGPIELSWVES